MKIFYAVLTALFAVGTLGDKDQDKRKIFALCFCVSTVALILLVLRG